MTWAGISPPRGGWRALGETDAATLEAAARAGIDEVADGDPRRHGRAARAAGALRGVGPRRRPGSSTCPPGAAFAAFSLGFLGDDAVRLFETGPWTRLTTRRGHVLVRRKPWTLKA